MKSFLPIAGLVIGIALGVFGAIQLQPAPAPQAGAIAGDAYSFPFAFRQTLTIGGNIVATSSVGTATYTAANFNNTTLIQHTAASALTVTLPASSTLTSFAPKKGDSRVICINAITTKITLAAGAGETLGTASSTKDIAAGQLGCLTFIRKSTADFMVLLTAD